jgi:hypothetical protein
MTTIYLLKEADKVKTRDVLGTSLIPFMSKKMKKGYLKNIKQYANNPHLNYYVRNDQLAGSVPHSVHDWAYSGIKFEPLKK